MIGPRRRSRPRLYERVIIEAGLLPADPVAGTPVQVHHSQDTDAVGPHPVDHGVWKPRNEPPSRLREDDRPGLRGFGDGADASCDFIKERGPEPWRFHLVIVRRLVQLTLSKAVERRRRPHLRRARASRNTSSAGREAPGVESHSASRRSASSAQSRAVSSSERSSRLLRRLCASRARSLGSRRRASASTSWILIGSILHHRLPWRNGSAPINRPCVDLRPVRGSSATV